MDTSGYSKVKVTVDMIITSNATMLLFLKFIISQECKENKYELKLFLKL